MDPKNSPEDLLDFPCQYTFKAIGASGDTFSGQITAAVRCHALTPADAVHIRPSGKGNYQSVSITVMLDNYQQLQDIYAGMKNIPGLKMLL